MIGTPDTEAATETPSAQTPSAETPSAETSTAETPSTTSASTRPASGRSASSRSVPSRLDAVLAASIDLARDALLEIAEPGTVGGHLGVEMLGERLAMQWFDCTAPGYRGWRWGVSLARVPRSKIATVCETNLLPSPDSVLAPEWLPYAERLAPGDLGAGDVLPHRDDDPYLEAGFEATGDEDVDQMGFFELGLGRPRVLSAEGREAAATRWYAGPGGPLSEVALKATARCSTCGYFVPMAGVLRSTFGACANEWSPSDGLVVSLDHGCGAHSETHAELPGPTPMGVPIVDELAVDLEAHESRVAVDAVGPVDTAEAIDPVDAAAPLDADDPVDSVADASASEQD